VRGVLRATGVLLLLVVLLGSAVLTLARLLEPGGRRWVQAEAFTPYGMLGYALVLLVALAWLVARRGRLLVAALLLIGAAGLGAHVSWFLPQVRGANPPASADAERITVMTANLEAGHGDALALVEAASRAGADVLVVQELTPAGLRAMESAGLEDLFPYRAGEPAPDVEGTMVFARWELGEVRALPTRMASFQVPVRVGGDELDLVAVHAAPPTLRSWAAEHRAVTDWVLAHRPDLVAGDLNATADHRPLRTLAAAGYRSVTALGNEGWRPTWPAARLLPPFPLVQIAHVLCGPSMAAVGSHTVAVTGSDHRAVVAEVARK